MGPAGAEQRTLCRAVHLRALCKLQAGAELTLDYGQRPLGDMLRSYAFVPADSCCEVRLLPAHGRTGPLWVCQAEVAAAGV